MTREELNKNIQKDIDNEENKEKRKKIFFITLKIISIFIIIFILFFLYNKFISTELIKVNEDRIISSKIPDNFNGLKVIQFSDILYNENTDPNKIDKVIKLINEREPDIVVYTGNLINSNYKLSSKEQEMLIKKLSKINSTLGNYYINGDMDKESYNTIMNQSNFNLLSNSNDLVYDNNNNSIMIVGLDSYNNKKQDIEKAFKGYSTKIYTIVLMSETDPIDKVIEKNPDIILAGSNLNGIVRLPVFGGTFKKEGSSKYINPYYKIKDTDVYVSSGIGVYRTGFRFFNRPSINFFRLSNR